MENKWSFTYLLVIVLIFNLQTKIELKSVREVSENENSPNDQTNASLKFQNITSNPILLSVQINSTDLPSQKNVTETLNQNISLSANGINAPQLNQNNSNSNISNGISNNSSSTTTTASILSSNSSYTVNTNTTTTSFSTTTTANTTVTTSLGHEVTTTKIDEKNDQKEENKEDPNDGNKDGQKEENKEDPNVGNKDDEKEENKEDPNVGNKDDENDDNDNANDDKNQLNDKDLDDFAQKEKEMSKDKNDNMEPPVKFVDIKNNPPDSNKFPYDNDEESSSGFLTYFLVISGICIAAYVVYHNKAKILGILIEGRPNRRYYRL
ncbi:flocculation FLO11-like isoform X2 [Brachionus plicatilis]|uniref:Flocculation FLO11-like isoform X2 n=1 Tax=Brachionus plicatilis TaxID=10195 RepID=A0A3M7QXL5_BRAPC|nr:flocculation FLO11-like isoform X2 [Brachionus plicatilis]